MTCKVVARFLIICITVYVLIPTCFIAINWICFSRINSHSWKIRNQDGVFKTESSVCSCKSLRSKFKHLFSFTNSSLRSKFKHLFSFTNSISTDFIYLFVDASIQTLQSSARVFIGFLLKVANQINAFCWVKLTITYRY